MNIYDLKTRIKLTVFSHDMLESLLQSSVNNINEKISQMTKKGDLVRLKRGIYIFGERFRDRPIDMIAVANMLQSPSYVSYEYALSYHGLIPERVYEITSATTKQKKIFETPIGRFSYQKVPLKAFSIGVDWLYNEEDGGRMVATPEKALCDTIRSMRGLGQMSQHRLLDYLENDLRIETGDLFALDAELIRAIAIAYNSAILRDLGAIIAKERKKIG
ncbi:type IV toxin-antitoxin system AbiEi family antitoxin domain-containing protein [Hydrogenimonas sp.]